MKEITFYYDVVCPFAYMASRLVEGVAARSGATVKWTPVLLGGLYGATDAPQGKDGSATSVMAPAKRAIVAADMQTQLQRYKVPFNFPSSHPQRTLDAMRLLAVSPTLQPASLGDVRSTELDNSIRRSLSDALYRAYWVDDQDLTDRKVLADVVNKVGWSVDVAEVLDSSSSLGAQAKKQLEANTQEAADRGAFGVPSFWVNDRLYWGVDRMCLVESAVSGQHAPMHRLAQVPPDAAQRPEQTLTIYFDFSSPWTFLGVSQIPDLLKSLQPLRIRVEWVPILLGAVFKAIGTPLVPMAALSPTKARYAQQDLQDWLQYHSVKLNFPSNFPLRTVLPLRVYCSQPDDKLRNTIFKSAWQEDLDIGHPEVLGEVLTRAGYDAKTLIAQAEEPAVKEMLKKSTARGIEAGICGAPSFQVNGGPVIFGQDRLGLVADLLCGWVPPDVLSAEAKLYEYFEVLVEDIFDFHQAFLRRSVKKKGKLVHIWTPDTNATWLFPKHHV